MHVLRATRFLSIALINGCESKKLVEELFEFTEALNMSYCTNCFVISANVEKKSAKMYFCNKDNRDVKILRIIARVDRSKTALKNTRKHSWGRGATCPVLLLI